MNAICSKCSKELDERFKKIVVNDKIICKECYDLQYRECFRCLTITNINEDYIYKQKQFCKKCFTDLYRICENCSDVFRINEGRYSNITNKWLCHDCFAETYTFCEACENEISKDNAYTYNDDYYCGKCYDERFIECAECSNIIWRDSAYYDDNEDEYLCEECRGDSVILNYSYRPTFKFNKMQYENTLYMGIELEVENKDEEKNVNNLAFNLKNFLTKEKIVDKFYFKQDGSINHGFEIVTHPFTLKYAHKHLKFDKILKWLNTRKFTSFDNEDCGLHIHLDKNFFSELEITKMRIFFSTNSVQLYKFSKREGKGETYAQYEDYQLKEFIRNKGQNGRYWAMNLNSSCDTIELRLFRGTLRYIRFIASLQFADAISYFVKLNGITSFIEGEHKYKKNSWLLFIDWCKTENKYNHLISFLRKEQLCV